MVVMVNFAKLGQRLLILGALELGNAVPLRCLTQAWVQVAKPLAFHQALQVACMRQLLFMTRVFSRLHHFVAW